jgi:hypothetical protein
MSIFDGSNENTQLVGKQVNELNDNKQFYMIVNKYIGNSYHEGENIYPMKIYPSNKHDRNGFKIKDFDSYFKSDVSNSYICECDILDDSICYIEKNEIETNKIFIKSITDIEKSSIWYDIDVCLKIVTQNAIHLKHVKKQTEEMCLIAVRQNNLMLEYVMNQTEEICLEAIKYNECDDSYYFRHVEDRTEEICLEAIKDNGFVLRWIKDQTEEMCLEAVKNNPYSLMYVWDQTEEICLEAVERDPEVIDFVKQKYKEICNEAIQKI